MRFIILTAFLMLLATFKVGVQGYVDIQKAIICSIESPAFCTDKWLLNINKRIGLINAIKDQIKNEKIKTIS